MICKKLLYLSASFLLVLAAGAAVHADNFNNIHYPIPELGGCKNKEACETYCDNSDNLSACVAFADKNGLMTDSEIQKAEVIANLDEINGPGGCSSDEECQSYCDNIQHISECLDFAREHGLMSEQELHEAELVAQAVAAGVGMPGGCTGKTSCDAYCADSAHMDECMTFALAAGLISGEEAEIVKKTGGQGPGGCKGKEECDAYCSNQDNLKTCIEFGLQYGLMPPEEAEQARKMLAALDKGVKMPACQKDQCDAYCAEPEHRQECMDFALAAGFITEEEAARMNSGEGRAVIGPGGCKSEQECHEYCSNPEHAGECGGGQSGEMQNPQGQENQPVTGPGGCKSEQECHEYCSNPEHAGECGGGQSGEMPANQPWSENTGQPNNQQQENTENTGTANPN